MPPKDQNLTQLFFKTKSGEYQPMPEIPELSLESEDIPNNSCTEYLKSKDFFFELIDKGKKQLAEFAERYLKIFKDIVRILKRIFLFSKRTFLCNNWRKKHHLPLIRQKRKRR